MGVQLEKQVPGYITHDRRLIPGEDGIYQAATELADEIMDGLTNLPKTHRLMAAHLFITDQGAKLILITWSIDMDPIDNQLDCILKRAAYDPATGALYTYEVPILELCSEENNQLILDE